MKLICVYLLCLIVSLPAMNADAKSPWLANETAALTQSTESSEQAHQGCAHSMPEHSISADSNAAQALMHECCQQDSALHAYTHAKTCEHDCGNCFSDLGGNFALIPATSKLALSVSNVIHSNHRRIPLAPVSLAIIPPIG